MCIMGPFIVKCQLHQGWHRECAHVLLFVEDAVLVKAYVILTRKCEPIATKLLIFFFLPMDVVYNYLVFLTNALPVSCEIMFMHYK